MSITGRFRPELMGTTPAGAVREPAAPSTAPTPAGPANATPGTPYGNWIDRMQRSRSRHAAITRNLYTWSSYKNWTERVRDSWNAEEAGAAGDPPKPRGR